MLLAGIGFQVVQSRDATAALAQQLPATDAHRRIFGELPVQRLVRCAGRFAVQVRQQVHAVERQSLRRRHAAGGRHGGQDVERAHRLFVDLARADPVRPLHHVRHPDAALPGRELAAGERRVAARAADRVAVVAHEDHDGVVLEPGHAQRVEHRTDDLVLREQHRVVAALRDVGDRPAQPVEVAGRDLQRRHRRVHREVQQERLVAVPLDELHRLVAEEEHQVLVDLDELAVAPHSVQALAGPRDVLQFVVEIHLDADDPGVVGPRRLHAGVAVEHDRFLEAAVVRQVLRSVTEVPLADDAGAVTLGPEQLADVLLGGGNAASQHLGLALQRR